MATRPRYSIDRDSLVGRYYVRDHRTGGVVPGADMLSAEDAREECDRLNLRERAARLMEKHGLCNAPGGSGIDMTTAIERAATELSDSGYADQFVVSAAIVAVRRELNAESLWRWCRDKTTAQAAAALRGEASS